GRAPPIDTAQSLAVRDIAKDLSIAWKDLVAGARKVTLTVETDLMTTTGKHVRAHALNLPLSPGQLTHKLTFIPAIEGPALDPGTSNWTIEITHVDGTYRELLRAFHGRGRPPERLTWEGLDPEGAVGVLKRGALHEVRLIVTDGYGERLE